MTKEVELQLRVKMPRAAVSKTDGMNHRAKVLTLIVLYGRGDPIRMIQRIIQYYYYSEH